MNHSFPGLRTIICSFLLFFICTSAAACSGNSSKGTQAVHTEPTSPKEVVFSEKDAHLDAPVFADIVSIFPECSLHRVVEGNPSPIDELVCKCQTTDGKTIWLYITESDYLRDFDSSAQFNDYSLDFVQEVAFSPSVRIHGTVRTTNIVFGLYNKTGATFLIEYSSCE